MTRKHTLQKIVIDQTALAATFEGETTVCGQLDLVSYYLFQENSAAFTGTLTIQFKNDDTDWATLPISAMVLAADDEIAVDVKTNFKYVRPVITVTGGTADFIVGIIGKTIGA